jgi:RNA polymerase sigma-70 factor (ECF subfamily)
MTAQPNLDYAALGDAEVARLCAARDGQAVRHVLTANNQRLFRTAWSILGDRSEAEEAVQAAYVSAFAAMERFEGRSSLSTWLVRITVNEALGRLRSQRRRRDHLEAAGVPMLDDYRDKLMRGSQAPAPEATVEREQLRALLEREVGALPENFRAVFVLREIEGLSVEETADALAPEVRTALTGTFPFAGADCAAMAERVLKDLGL